MAHLRRKARVLLTCAQKFHLRLRPAVASETQGRKRFCRVRPAPNSLSRGPKVLGSKGHCKGQRCLFTPGLLQIRAPPTNSLDT